jgi:glycosyltransferase involved in cell wall biosynthesis
MKIFFDNWNPNSSSGPNSFGKKLYSSLEEDGQEVFWAGNFKQSPDVRLSFIQEQVPLDVPTVQRLDGIYFNNSQDFKSLNSQILQTYNKSDVVIFQSDFNKMLTESWFGAHDRSYVIRNGTNLHQIAAATPMESDAFGDFENVWSCASSWRPHKRLGENITYFLENSGNNDCLIVAGENPDVGIAHPRVFYAGHLDWYQLISLFKRSKFFLHLAWLDHCPNVVVDARACGCHIVCSSAGGTKEIAGENSTIIVEDEWDFSPINLYSPPKMDFSKVDSCTYETSIDINDVSKEYFSVFKELVG